MEIIAAGATDVGKIRSSNEDAFLVDAERGLFAVADGMGGESAGEVASHLALHTIHGFVASAPASAPPVEVLRGAIEAANAAVVQAAAADASKAKMGTTITALLVLPDRAIVGHVGDSRLYRVRWGEVAKLTEDHTAVAELVKAGVVKAEEAHSHPWAHILSRVVGRGGVEVQMTELDVASGDRFLLCSDGFSDSLTDPQWLALLDAKPPAESVAELVARAVELDGRDNATAVVVALGDEARREDRRSTWQEFRRAVRESLQALTGRKSSIPPA